MEIKVKTKSGTITFIDLNPGMDMDVHLPDRTLVSINTHAFRSIKYDDFSIGSVTSGNAPEDDMVRVSVYIDYKSGQRYNVTLEPQELPIKTKKCLFTDLSGFKIEMK